MSIENNKELARRLTQLLDRDDVEQIEQLLAPEFVSHFAGLSQPLNREQYIQVNQAARSAFSDLSRTVEDLIAEGDKVTLRITARGTHTGIFQGIAASGKKTEITGIAIRRIVDGKIVEEWVVNDQLGLMQQLGIFKMPPPKKP
jgi:steroid delta-isomerase-like uncharacterized protein